MHIRSKDGIKLCAKVTYPDTTPPYPAIALGHGFIMSKDTGHIKKFAKKLTKIGFLVLRYDFRGHKCSEGACSLTEEYKDTLGAVEYLCSMDNVDKSRIIAAGHSMGAAASIVAGAKDRRVKIVFAISPPARWRSFDSGFRRYAGRIYIKVGAYITGTKIGKIDFQNALNPIDVIADISPRKVVIVHGKYDMFVRFSEAEELYKSAKEPKRFYKLSCAHDVLDFKLKDVVEIAKKELCFQ